MSNLSGEFKKLHRGKRPDESVFVPLLMWCSGKKSNSEPMQKINRRFYKVNRKILISELTLTNTVDHFLKFPKEKKKEKPEFFYKDVAHYFGWTPRELKKNLSVVDLKELKEIISNEYAYDDKQRKKLSSI